MELSVVKNRDNCRDKMIAYLWGKDSRANE